MTGQLYVCGLGAGTTIHYAPNGRACVGSSTCPVAVRMQHRCMAVANGEGLFAAVAQAEDESIQLLYVWGAAFNLLDVLHNGGVQPVPRHVPNAQHFSRVTVGHGSVAAVSVSGELWLTHLAPAAPDQLRRIILPVQATDAR